MDDLMIHREIDDINAMLAGAADEDRERWERLPDIAEPEANGQAEADYEFFDPPEPTSTPATRLPIINARVEYADGERIVTPLPMGDILGRIRLETDRTSLPPW